MSGGEAHSSEKQDVFKPISCKSNVPEYFSRLKQGKQLIALVGELRGNESDPFLNLCNINRIQILQTASYDSREYFVVFCFKMLLQIL